MVKEIPEFSGRYFVSDDGFVINKYGKNLKPSINPITGYCQVNLFRDGKPNMRYVHRLVATAFINKPAGTCEVNHKDGNKRNNAASNLEWTDRSTNMLHAYRNGLHKTTHIAAYTKYGEFVRTFDSVREAMAFCGVEYNAGISRCITGKVKTAHGYRWEYI